MTSNKIYSTERGRKIAEALRGKPSGTKGKTWNEMYGVEKANERRMWQSNWAISLNENRTVWNKGLTKETDVRVASNSLATAKTLGSRAYRDNHPISEETRQKYIGRKNCNPGGYGKWGFRDDLDYFFRSTWEANFARILNFIGIQWEYENSVHRARFDSSSYLPDFYLPQLDLFVEIKGYDRNPDWLQKLFDYRPSFPLILIGENRYRVIERIFKKLIPSWEK